MFKKIDSFFLYLLLLGLFFFKIPSFYIIPFFKNPFTTSQALARIFVVLVFCFHIIDHFFTKNSLVFKKQAKLPVNLIILLFVIQSLTILVSINSIDFLSRYKDIIIAFLAFFDFYFYKKYLREIAIVLLFSIVINACYQSIIVFYQDFFVRYLSNFIYQKHVDLVISKLQNNKIYTDTYDEILIPLLFVFPFKTNLVKNLALYVFSIFITFFSFVSNIRSRVLMLFISVAGSLIEFKKVSLKTIFVITFSVLVVGFLINNVMNYVIGYSFVDRLILQDQLTDVKPINSRLNQIQNALEMGSSNWLGVGLGNYYDNLNSTQKDVITTINRSLYTADQSAQEFVHNVFGAVLAESGYISLIVFLAILIIFARDDLALLKTGSEFQKAYVIAFWSLFSYGLFNPISTASYQVLFWGIRGLLLEP